MDVERKLATVQEVFIQTAPTEGDFSDEVLFFWLKVS